MTVTFQLAVQLGMLMALAVMLPTVLGRMLPASLRMVLVNILISASVMWLIGTVMMAGPYFWREGGSLMGMFRDDPGGGLWWLARQGLMPALAWGPMLALAELSLAQKIAAAGPIPPAGGRTR